MSETLGTKITSGESGLQLSNIVVVVKQHGVMCSFTEIWVLSVSTESPHFLTLVLVHGYIHSFARWTS